MKYISSTSSRQIIAAVIVITTVGAGVIVPWRIPAQEPTNALLEAATNPPVTPHTNTTEMKRYRSEEWKFAIDIPRRWNAFPPVSSNSPFELIRFESKEDGAHALIIFRNPFDPKVSLKEYADEIRKVLASQGFGNFVFGETTIGSRPVVTLDFDKSQDGGTWSCREYFIADGTLVHTLGFGTSNKAARFELFDRMAKSFEILALETAHANTTEMERYKSAKWNFAIDIPRRWNTFPPVSSNSPFEVIRFMSKEDGTHSLIIFRDPHDPTKSLQNHAERIQKILAKGGFGNFVFGETTIGSRPAVTLDFDKSTDDGTRSCREYFIADGTMVYGLGFGTSNKAAKFELYDCMAKSFEILPEP